MLRFVEPAGNDPSVITFDRLKIEAIAEDAGQLAQIELPKHIRADSQLARGKIVTHASRPGLYLGACDLKYFQDNRLAVTENSSLFCGLMLSGAPTNFDIAGYGRVDLKPGLPLIINFAETAQCWSMCRAGTHCSGLGLRLTREFFDDGSSRTAGAALGMLQAIVDGPTSALVVSGSARLNTIADAALNGLPGAFFTIALPAIMRDGGASLMQIGFIYIVWAPSALKWLWAPWFERMPRPPFGSTFAWMRWLAVAIALTFLPVSLLVDRMAVWPLVGLAVLSAALSVTLQLLLAGWLMTTFEEKTRAIANGVGVAGMVAGGVGGGGLLPSLANSFGWDSAVGLLAVAIAATAVGTVWLRPPASTPAPNEGAGSFRLAWQELLKLRSSRALLLTLLLMSVSSGADITVPARLVDAGIDPAQVALLLGLVATLAIIPVSALTGLSLRRWGHTQVLSLLCIAKALVLGLLATAVQDASFVAALSVLDFMLAGALTVVVWQIYMNRASQFATPISGYGALTALDAAMRMVAGIGAGAIGTALGYSSLFTAAAILSILAVTRTAAELNVITPAAQMARVVIVPAAAAVLMFAIDCRLALIADSVLVPFAFMILASDAIYRRTMEKLLVAREQLASRIFDLIDGMQVLRSYGQQKDGLRHLESACERHRRLSNEITAALTRTMAAGWIILESGFVLLILGGLMVAEGLVSGTSWLLFVVVGLAFYGPIADAFELNGVWRQQRSCIRRLRTILDLPALPESERARLPASLEIRFENVSFAYDETPVLSGLNLLFEPGKMHAITGPSGAGKSTILNLIARFWDPVGGRITIGGVDLLDIHPALRSKLSRWCFKTLFFSTTRSMPTSPWRGRTRIGVRSRRLRGRHAATISSSRSKTATIRA